MDIDKMTENDIKNALETRLPERKTSSAVLILFVERETGWEIIFETRSASVSQPGQVSFPGGHLEDGETAEQAVLREVQEEIGVRPEDIRIIGELPRERIQGGKLVKPFAGVLKKEAFESISPSDEVAAVFSVPVRFFMGGSGQLYRYKMKIIEDNDALPEILKRHFSVEKPYGLTKYWEYEGNGIWGLTARLLSRLIYLLDPENEVPSGI